MHTQPSEYVSAIKRELQRQAVAAHCRMSHLLQVQLCDTSLILRSLEKTYPKTTTKTPYTALKD